MRVTTRRGVDRQQLFLDWNAAAAPLKTEPDRAIIAVTIAAIPDRILAGKVPQAEANARKSSSAGIGTERPCAAFTLPSGVARRGTYCRQSREFFHGARKIKDSCIGIDVHRQADVGRGGSWAALDIATDAFGHPECSGHSWCESGINFCNIAIISLVSFQCPGVCRQLFRNESSYRLRIGHFYTIASFLAGGMAIDVAG